MAEYKLIISQLPELTEESQKYSQSEKFHPYHNLNQGPSEYESGVITARNHTILLKIPYNILMPMRYDCNSIMTL